MNNDQSFTCPKCPNTDPARFVGHNVRGVYDGVLVWQCEECGFARPRFFGSGTERRQAAGQRHADTLNAVRTQS